MKSRWIPLGILLLPAFSCTTQVDGKKKVSYLDEIAGLCSLALTAPSVDPELLKIRVADLKADAEAHYK